jgi:hypothetical protein
VGTHVVEHLGEIGEGHVVLFRKHTTVGAAMAAIQVTTKGTFPKQLVQLVLIDALLQHSTIEFEHHLFVKA